MDDADRAEERLARLAVRHEPLTYERGNGQSFFRDTINAAHGAADAAAARARLDCHAAEMRVELKLREHRNRARFDRQATDGRWTVERRDLTRVDGTGGQFVPPLYLVDQFAGLARAGRVLADLVRRIPLPAGVDSIVAPRVTTGAAVAMQTADNAAVQETDQAETAVTAPVRTVAGQTDVAIQLLEQGSPLTFDEVIFAELMSDYDAKLGVQLVGGSGSSGQILGVLGSGGNAVTYTDATPTVAELQPKVADAASQAATLRLPTAIVMHPRRWFWLTAATDSAGQPLVPPSQDAPDPDRPEGLVGSMLGLPVYADPGVPTDLGAVSNEDRIVVTRASDALLFESGDPRLRIGFDPGSGTLTARLSLVRYVAFTAALYPAGTSIVSGIGLATPTFG